MNDATPTTKSTCDASKTATPEVLPEVLQDRLLAGSSPATAATLPSPPGRQAGGKHGGGRRVRNREAEKAARIARMGLTIGRCGEMAEQVRVNVGRLRKGLENHTLEARGVITAVEQLAINQACRFELLAQLAMAWLQKDEAKLTPSERLQHANSIANASANRDKAVDRLRLGGDSKDELAAFYSNLAREAPEKSPTATEGAKATADTLEHGNASPAFPSHSGEVQR